MPDSVRRGLTTQGAARPHRSLASAVASLRSSGVRPMRIELDPNALASVLDAGQPIVVMAHTPRGLLPALIAAVDTTTRSVQLVDPATSRPLPLIDLDNDLDPSHRGGLILVAGDEIPDRHDRASWYQPLDASDQAIGDRRLMDLDREEAERVDLLRRNAHELASARGAAVRTATVNGLADLAVAAEVEQFRRASDAPGLERRIATDLLHRPESTTTRCLWASHLVRSGRSSEAVLALASLDHQTPAVQVVSARVERAFGRCDTALELLDSAIQTDPANLDALIERADLTVSSIEHGRTHDIVGDPRGVLGIGSAGARLPYARQRLIEMSTVELAVLEERFDDLEAVALLGGRLSLAVGDLDEAETSFAAVRTSSTMADLCRAVLTDLRGGFGADVHRGLIEHHGHDIRVWALTIGSALRAEHHGEAKRLHALALGTEILGLDLLAPLSDRLATLTDRHLIDHSHDIKPGDSPAAGQA